MVNAQPQSISGVINQYTPVLSVDTCTARLSVSDTAGFHAGDRALLIQMQGAAIRTQNNAAYGEVLSLDGAGLFEQVYIDSVQQGQLYLRYPLQHRYDPAGMLQLVSFPHFQSAVVEDTLYAQPWNGVTGGVLALSVSGSLTLNAPLCADGAGFRGGKAFLPGDNNCSWLLSQTAYVYGPGNWRGSYKGEGLARTDPDKVLGRGPQANGGGGGNDHNSGGGGGANGSAGGDGGANEEPSSFGCDGYFPGLGGIALSADSMRVFQGGGGGAGHANNNLGSAGGNGGGIIFLFADSLLGPDPVLSANGFPGATANGDGGGGGGGGGTVWASIRYAVPGVQVSANGGSGGHTYNNNQDRCFGPGGGGSGGRILTNLTGIPIPAAGLPGTVQASVNGCAGSTNGAEPGQPGLLQSLPARFPAGEIAAIFPVLRAGPFSDTVCLGETAVLSVLTNPGPWIFQWEILVDTVWMAIGPGQGYVGYESPSLQVMPVTLSHHGAVYRCVIQKPGCFSLSSSPATLTVPEVPQAAFSTLMTGATVQFANQSTGASQFWWEFGDGTFSSEASPEHTYADEGIYLVTLFAISSCDTATSAQTLNVVFGPVAAFAAPDSLVDCELVHLALQNQSSANSVGFLWLFPGGTPSSSTIPDPQVTYETTGTYPVTLIAYNAGGADTVVQYVVVQVIGYPVAEFEYVPVGNGLIQFSNLSQFAATPTWYFGDGSDPVSDPDPLHQYLQSGVYTVTLIADNYCGSSVFQQMIKIELVGVTESIEKEQPVLYPNPAGESAWLDCSAVPDRLLGVALVDCRGRSVVQRIGADRPAYTLSLVDLPPGVYFVQCYFEKGVWVKKLVRQ